MASPAEATPAKRRALPPRFFVGALLAMAALHFWLPGAVLIDSSLQWLGAAPVAGGLGVIVWCERLFKSAGTTIKPFQESSALLLDGPYRVSRNPIYLSMVLVLLGTGVLLGTLTPFVVVPVFVALIEMRFIRAEEAALAERFGEPYAEYCGRVRRWL